MIGLVRNLLEANKAVTLTWQAVKIACRVDNNLCAVNYKLKVRVDLEETVALVSAHQNFVSVYLALID